MAPTLLLDLDGTLIDSVPDIVAAVNRLAGSRGFRPFDRAEVTPMVGDGTRTLLERVFAARGAPFDDAVEGPYVADYTAHSADETRPFPGVIDTLQRFADRGWKLAVCTNKPASATHAVLAALGLTPFLSAIGGGDSFAARKPDPRHVLGTLELAGGSVDAALMVGDHHNDVRASAAAGIPCIFAAWGYGPLSMAEGAVEVAERFEDLPEIAEELLPQRAG